MNATASGIGVGWTKILGLVTRRNRPAITIGINVNAAPSSAAESASSNQARATT